MRIRQGDKVRILQGKDRGKSGVVVAADHTTRQVKVEGVNIYKRHQRKGRSDRHPGGVVEIVAPLSASRVQLVCPSCGKPTRVGYQIAGGKKERVCKQCKAVISYAKK
jgi:large subunit ribosomal protein L24